MKTILEICAGSIESAIAAFKGGADRIELCSALPLDGLTPSYGAILYAKENIPLIINILIRPRDGDFCYSQTEIQQMIYDIETAGKAHCNGVVIGALNKEGWIDTDLCKRLIDRAKKYDMSVTFHRAIDVGKNIFENLEQVISLGADRILTSGGCKSAYEGINIIAQMEKQADGRIIIMPGGGVNPQNAEEIIRRTGVREIHLSAKKLRAGGYSESDEKIIREISSKLL